MQWANISIVENGGCRVMHHGEAEVTQLNEEVGVGAELHVKVETVLNFGNVQRFTERHRRAQYF